MTLTLHQRKILYFMMATGAVITRHWSGGSTSGYMQYHLDGFGRITRPEVDWLYRFGYVTHIKSPLNVKRFSDYGITVKGKDAVK